MKPSDPKELLHEILADAELDQLRRTSLDAGLTVVRRTRRQQSVLRVSLLAGLPVLLALAFALAWRQLPTAQPNPVVAAVRPVSPSPVAPPAPTQVETISDAQLFALFSGRPLALIGSPGHQQALFLDGPKQN
ncbi:MAG TPA: hypothetical protein VL527_15995 [Dongiaceae bacterium]|jgi:hypothetical protein|nr:hypothetical protein [Dongiaceae bacterium]